MTPTSGKGPRRDAVAWSDTITSWCEENADIAWSRDIRNKGAQVILRLRERGATDADAGTPIGGTAVLTLYATGSWTWGGDADVVAYVREPLDVHGLL